jgi:hypothetical protein
MLNALAIETVAVPSRSSCNSRLAERRDWWDVWRRHLMRGLFNGQTRSTPDGSTVAPPAPGNEKYRSGDDFLLSVGLILSLSAAS